MKIINKNIENNFELEYIIIENNKIYIFARYVNTLNHIKQIKTYYLLI